MPNNSANKIGSTMHHPRKLYPTPRKSQHKKGCTYLRSILIFESSLRKCHTKGKDRQKAVFSFGGLEEIRTPDPHNANVVRSQLRYKPVCCGICRS